MQRVNVIGVWQKKQKTAHRRPRLGTIVALGFSFAYLLYVIHPGTLHRVHRSPGRSGRDAAGAPVQIPPLGTLMEASTTECIGDGALMTRVSDMKTWL